MNQENFWLFWLEGWGLRKLLRGGSWFDVPLSCRSSYRGGSRPGAHYGLLGFRVCCLPPGPSLSP